MNGGRGFERVGDLLRGRHDEILTQLARPATSADADVLPTCLLCGDSGYVRRDIMPGQPGFGAPFPCVCGLALRRRVRRIWASAGVPPKLADASFETFPADDQTRPIVELVRDVWLDRSPAWLVLIGPVGRGKSGISVSALRVFVERGQTGLFVPAPNLFDRIRQTWDETLGVKEHELHEALRTVDVLVIDDLGKEQVTDWVQTRLFVLLNDRYNANLRTVITTNYPVHDLSARIGEPAMSRIEDAAGPDDAYVLRVEGSDLRQTRRAL